MEDGLYVRTRFALSLPMHGGPPTRWSLPEIGLVLEASASAKETDTAQPVPG
jgi:hypothetical protein